METELETEDNLGATQVETETEGKNPDPIYGNHLFHLM